MVEIENRKEKEYFREQRKNPTGKFTEFVVRTYYFLYEQCFQSENKMICSSVTNQRSLIDFVYKGFYEKLDHAADSVVKDCINHLKEMSYIGFKMVDGKWMIYIKNDLDFLLPNEHEKYIGVPELKKKPIENVQKSRCAFNLYRYKKKCYHCGEETTILTYITYADNPKESMNYPWDKERALSRQDIIAHLKDHSIEYYGIHVIGDIDPFDKKLMELYPKQIAVRYSNTTKTRYPLNLCEHCGAIQGRYFVYRDINLFITQMKELELFEECIIQD